MTVTIDVIRGTSAGGINGVFLAMALTRDLPQDPLTTMWLQRADLRKLAHRRLPGRLGALIGIALVLPWRLRSKMDWSPLDGGLMSQWLVEALAGMDAAGGTGSAGETLLPADHDLDLFVTTRGLRGYERVLLSPDGGPGEHDRIHRKVFHFNSGPSGPSSRFGPADNAGLAFAACCTSSFRARSHRPALTASL
jgi:hypothetical protein